MAIQTALTAGLGSIPWVFAKLISQVKQKKYFAYLGTALRWYSGLSALVSSVIWGRHMLRQILPKTVYNRNLGDIKNWGWDSEYLECYTNHNCWQLVRTNGPVF